MASNFTHRRCPYTLRASAQAVLGFALSCTLATAQTAAEGTLSTITVKPSLQAAQSNLAGFGDVPVADMPLSLKVLDANELATHHVRRMADVLQLDASASDAYNAIGYWDYVTLRGFVLDQNYNYRRDGMPINASTILGLDNRERIEILKGTSGIQSGTSAPGGLVNHVVKRPTETDLRQIRLEASSQGNKLAHLDLGGRFGIDNAFGYRLNVAAEDLSNHVVGADGNRQLAALALDWRIDRDSLLEVELEHSYRKQASVPGLSLTGNTLPAPNPFLNINSQPWSQPGTMQGNTGSVRYTRSVNSQWDWTVHAASQQLKANDYLAYPYGCYDAASDKYYADRYCPNGNFDLYDYRSLNERRRTDSLQWQLRGQFAVGETQHHLTTGLMRTRFSETGQPQADNNDAVGTGNLYTLPTLPANATFADPYTNRYEYSTELFVTDRIQWTNRLSTWLGARHSELDRASIRTDGTRATRYNQSFTTPWVGLTWKQTPTTMLFASAGDGIESKVAPGRSRYTNAGLPLPALRSKQMELGAKQQWENGHAQATVFRIVRPRADDSGTCGAPGTCTLQMDGDDLHQGLELSASQRWGIVKVDGSAMWLSAQRRNGAIAPELNGLRPTNVPARVLRAGAQVAVPQVPGLSLRTQVSAESSRNVLPDGSITLPGWARWDAGLTYQTKVNQATTTWRMTVQNLTNRRYFKEAPYQYSHVYLFPAAPRTVYLGVDWSL